MYHATDVLNYAVGLFFAHKGFACNLTERIVISENLHHPHRCVDVYLAPAGASATGHVSTDDFLQYLIGDDSPELCSVADVDGTRGRPLLYTIILGVFDEFEPNSERANVQNDSSLPHAAHEIHITL